MPSKVDEQIAFARSQKAGSKLAPLKNAACDALRAANAVLKDNQTSLKDLERSPLYRDAEVRAWQHPDQAETSRQQVMKLRESRLSDLDANTPSTTATDAATAVREFGDALEREEAKRLSPSLHEVLEADGNEAIALHARLLAAKTAIEYAEPEEWDAALAIKYAEGDSKQISVYETVIDGEAKRIINGGTAKWMRDRTGTTVQAGVPTEKLAACHRVRTRIAQARQDRFPAYLKTARIAYETLLQACSAIVGQNVNFTKSIYDPIDQTKIDPKWATRYLRKNRELP